MEALLIRLAQEPGFHQRIQAELLAIPVLSPARFAQRLGEFVAGQVRGG